MFVQCEMRKKIVSMNREGSERKRLWPILS